MNNRKLTIRELAEDLNIAYGSIQDIVNGLGLRVATKLVPKELNFMQKKDRVVIAKDMISKAESDPTSNASLLETKRGFMSMTCNPDIRRVNGKLQMSQDQKTTTFSVEKESDAHGFHGLQRYCTSRIFARRSDS